MKTIKIIIGAQNWQTLLGDASFWSAFRQNVIVMVFSILLQIPIGLLLTTFLDAGGKKFNAFKTVCFFPYLMSSVAIAFLFNCILAAIGGLFSSLAQLITGKRTTVDLLGKNPQAMFAAIDVMAWQYTPFYMVYFSACFLSAGTYEIQAAHLHLRGIVAMMSIPMHVTLIPIFKMTNWMGLYDNLYSLLGPYVAFALPMSIYILTGFMMTIPKEVEEAAVIDGCNKYSLFYYIFIPLSKSGLSTLAIYNGVTMWNEFAFANTLLQSAAQKTLPLALGQFKGEHSMDMPIILSVLVLSVLPMIILFIVFQDKLVKGMMSGAVKG